MTTGSFRAITITKLDAAYRQLQTALKLWLEDGDPVAIHTLAAAAYEVAHVVSKKRNAGRRPLVFDARGVSEERRSEFNRFLKHPASFFKHASRDAEATIKFSPLLSDMFMMHAIMGLEMCGLKSTQEQTIFLLWYRLHRPNYFEDKRTQIVVDSIPVNDLAQLRKLSRREFTKTVLSLLRVASS